MSAEQAKETEDPSDTERENGSAYGLHWRIATAIAVIIVLVLAVVMRIQTEDSYTWMVDEPFTLLAIQRTAELGYPKFPSGVLYLQGATFSYLAAPLAWIYSETELLQASRYYYMGITVFLVPLTMKLAHTISRNALVSIVVGLLVAFDPNIIRWSVTIRPYGLLAMAVAGLLLLFVLLLRDGPKARVLFCRVVYLLPAVSLFGTFTHIGFWLAVPGIVVVGLLTWRMSLFGENRAILYCGIASVAPLILFFLLSRFVGTGAGTGSGVLGGSVVGGHLFSGNRSSDLATFNIWPWIRLYYRGDFHQLIPYIVLASSLVILFVVFWPASVFQRTWQRNAVAVVLAVHWIIILAVMSGISSSNPRYLLHVAALGHLVVVLALWVFWNGLQNGHVLATWTLRILLTVIVLFPMFNYVVSSSRLQAVATSGGNDYWAATQWVSENRKNNELVITAMPGPLYFWFEEEEFGRLMFLAGPQTSVRSTQYVRLNEVGSYGDYWLGLPSIADKGALCDTLLNNAGHAYIIVDENRLTESWAMAGTFENVITGASVPEYEGHKIMALKVHPVIEWSDEALGICGISPKRAHSYVTHLGIL